jgi:Zn finger protein HypA/HybF involved in hydrogenase expression
MKLTKITCIDCNKKEMRHHLSKRCLSCASKKSHITTKIHISQRENVNCENCGSSFLKSLKQSGMFCTPLCRKIFNTKKSNLLVLKKSSKDNPGYKSRKFEHSVSEGVHL